MNKPSPMAGGLPAKPYVPPVGPAPPLPAGPPPPQPGYNQAQQDPAAAHAAAWAAYYQVSGMHHLRPAEPHMLTHSVARSDRDRTATTGQQLQRQSTPTTAARTRRVEPIRELRVWSTSCPGALRTRRSVTAREPLATTILSPSAAAELCVPTAASAGLPIAHAVSSWTSGAGIRCWWWTSAAWSLRACSATTVEPAWSSALSTASSWTAWARLQRCWTATAVFQQCRSSATALHSPSHRRSNSLSPAYVQLSRTDEPEPAVPASTPTYTSTTSTATDESGTHSTSPPSSQTTAFRRSRCPTRS